MVAELYSAVTKLQGFALSQEQADNIAMIYDAFVKHGGIRKRHIAYIIATAYHEGVRKENYENAMKRIKNHQAQLLMF